jgi:hypothetical protein
MAMSDIQRIRQQYIFNPVEDITGGGMGMGDFGYAPRGGGGYNMPPIGDEGPSRSPFDFRQEPTPTFPDMGIQAPRVDPLQQVGAPSPPVANSQYDPNKSLDATIEAINRVYTPETVDRDRFRALLDKAPERGSPSFARSLVAAGLSLKAQDPIKTAEQVMYAPYLRDMADWTAKADPFSKAAQLENTANINERTLAGNVVTAHTQAERLAEQARQADQKAEISRIRAMADQARAAKWTIVTKGNTVIAVSPDGTQTRNLGTIPGVMTESEKIALEGKWDVETAKARGESALAVTNVRESELYQDSQGNIFEWNQATKSMIPRTGNSPVPVGNINRIGTPSQSQPPRGPNAPRTNTLEDIRIRNEKMRNLYELDPTARKWITRSPDGSRFTMKNRPTIGQGAGIFPWSSSGATQQDIDDWDAVRKEIDPSYVPPPAGQAPATDKGVGPTGTGTTPSGGGRGLGPSRPPTGTTTTTIPQQAGRQPTNQQTDQQNPMNKRRSFDGGKTWQHSTDGGKTWK